MASRDNGQMAHIVQEAREWVQTNGNKVETIQDAIKVALASHDYIVERINRNLAAPMWAVAAGLFVNAGWQIVKWLLGS